MKTQYAQYYISNIGGKFKGTFENYDEYTYNNIYDYSSKNSLLDALDNIAQKCAHAWGKKVIVDRFKGDPSYLADGIAPRTFLPSTPLE